MEGLGFNLRTETEIQSRTEEVLKTSEIEGEKLDRAQVRSSIARRLGLDAGGLTRIDRNVEGIVEMMLDAKQKFDTSLTPERLFGWHGALFPTGRSGLNRIRVGKWRDDKDGPMQIEDGNGRMARAIADMTLARSEKSPHRFYSMSAQICLEHKFRLS